MCFTKQVLPYWNFLYNAQVCKGRKKCHVKPKWNSKLNGINNKRDLFSLAVH